MTKEKVVVRWKVVAGEKPRDLQFCGPFVDMFP
jgi:hypothetical protein